MATEPTGHTLQFMGPVENVFISKGTMHIIYKDGTEQTFLFLAPPLLLSPDQIVGRAEQFQVLKQRLLATSPISELALIGLPGVGKTTLATLFAWDPEVLKHFTGGVLWASLGPTSDLDVLLNQWAWALGTDVTKEPTSTARAARVQAALGGQPFLIVLDDVWSEDHVVLLRRVTGPGCAHLLTTRDETIARSFTAPDNIVRIEELSEAEAVQLLGDLCPAVRENTVALSQLARAVGGLPLGLRLIGGYLAEHSTFAAEVPQALEALTQVESRLELRDRQQRLTLREVIGVSVEALPNDPAKRAFTALGAFAPKPANFSLAAVQEVTGADIATLGVLVRRNLLEKVSDDRVALHQSLADVATTGLAVGDPAISRHAVHYLALIKNIRGLVRDNQMDWSVITGDLPQIRHAWGALPADNPDQVLEFVFAMSFFHTLQGLWRERIVWVEQGVHAAQTLGQLDTEANLLNDLGRAHLALGEQQQALECLKRATALLEATGKQGEQAVALNNLGGVYRALGERQQALEYFTKALKLMEEIGRQAGRGGVLHNIGSIYHEQEEHAQSLIYLMQALPLLKAEGDVLGEASALHYLGGISNALGEHRWALQWLQQAFNRREAIGDRPGMAETLSLMGGVYNDMGDQRQALEYRTKALAFLEAVGNPTEQGTELYNLGGTYYQLGNYRQAIAYFQQALSIWETVNDEKRQAQTLLIMGEAYQKLGELQQALQNYERALVVHKVEDEIRGTILHDLGEVYHTQENRQKALDYYTQALSVRKTIDDQAGQSTTLHNIGVLYNDQGEYMQGLEYLEQALAIRKTIGWLSAERTTLLAMTVSYFYLKELEEDERALTRVVELSKTLNDPELEQDLADLERVRAWRRQTGM
jgi:tetratricopeptide (TPR) repeat protein